MGSRPLLSTRASTILNLLVDEYVRAATPVPSEGIARSPALKGRPATVCSTKSQVTEECYISRPLISVGGVPSDHGYRNYVESLEHPTELPRRIRWRACIWLEGAEPDASVEARRCAAALSQKTVNLANVTEPRSTFPILKRMQLVFLQESVALAVVIVVETRLRKPLLPPEDTVSQQRLDQADERVNYSAADLNHEQVKSRGLGLSTPEQRVLHDSLKMTQ